MAQHYAGKLRLLTIFFLSLSAALARAQTDVLAVGNYNLLAVHADGTLWGSGSNADGRLGDGTTTDRALPVQIGNSTAWQQLSSNGGPAGNFGTGGARFSPNPGYILALQADGSLWGWGSNDYGRLVYAGGNRPQLIDAGPWACVAAGETHGVGVRADGTLWAWGSNWGGILGNNDPGSTANYVLPIQIDTATNWASVSAGPQFTLALRTDGTLWSWGQSSDGQLGMGPNSADMLVPTQIGTAANWAAISAGRGYALALRTEGTLWAWGSTRYGIPGAVAAQAIDSPVQLGTATNWTRIAAGDNHALALRADGTLWSWGRNHLGQLGNGSTLDVPAPAQVGTGTSWQRVAAGGFMSAAMQADGTLWTWGDNRLGETGRPDLLLAYVPTPTLVNADTSWRAAAATTEASIALQADGSLWTWGRDGLGLLGDGPLTDRQTVARIDAPATYRFVGGGDTHLLAIRTDGTLWAWGNNYAGQLGDGSITPREAPVPIGAGQWLQAAGGSNYSLAIRADSTLWAWGENNYGELGIGNTRAQLRPVRVGTAHNWKQVICVGSTVLALQGDGSLWAWGGSHYLFGNGSAAGSNQTTPLRIGTLNTWAQVAGAEAHVLALQNDGTLWAWGNNQYGQLGDGTITSRALPVRIGSDTDWTTIAASRAGGFSAALKRNGTLWTWGSNLSYALGDAPALLQRLAPAQVGTASNWTTLAAGAQLLAGRADGTLWSWSANRYGQTGTPSYGLLPAAAQTGLRPAAPLGVTAFNPAAGLVGSTVTISGVGLGNTQLLTFGGVPAVFTVNAAGTILTATVPVGAQSGPVFISGPNGGLWSSTAFQVIAAPVISSFAPLAAAPGATVTVTGTGLGGTTSLLVGGVAITSFQVNAAGTAISFVVPAGLSNGLISLTTAVGTATSTAALTIVLSASLPATATRPSIWPMPVRVGQPLEITGLPHGAFTVEQFTVLGQCIRTACWPATHGERIMLSSVEQPGMYILRLRTTTGTYSYRLLVE
ncbi:IPT/TIG domain-containing protein [Hymenobacter sp. ASUV-10]|uniref:IPT/TIG domain-containing protein n=1 Tax=Hymenobacter aranciens TaxID=3063996 RepID=A0ABT9BAC3_9BACT|nr:IPT/TIG domain-containing protein [Hymenobacter sp. ASUV-10]MDO7874720.1 IPT/TIG domain-containing protein [Hymenobacter sp. ASUV-10]